MCPVPGVVCRGGCTSRAGSDAGCAIRIPLVTNCCAPSGDGPPAESKMRWAESTIASGRVQMHWDSRGVGFAFESLPEAFQLADDAVLVPRRLAALDAVLADDSYGLREHVLPPSTAREPVDRRSVYDLS